MTKKNKVELVVFLILLVILVLFLSTYFSLKNKKNQPENNLSSIESEKRQLTPTYTPTPRTIPHGKKGFTVGQSDKIVPQFRKGSIDPYDPVKGGIQTVTIAVKHSKPVTKVTAVLNTDHTISQPYPFKLVKGSDTDGEWQGSWYITDTYLYSYVLTLNAVSSDSSGSVIITLR